MSHKLKLIADDVSDFGGLEAVEKCLIRDPDEYPNLRRTLLREEATTFGEYDEIPF